MKKNIIAAIAAVLSIVVCLTACKAKVATGNETTAASITTPAVEETATVTTVTEDTIVDVDVAETAPEDVTPDVTPEDAAPDVSETHKAIADAIEEVIASREHASMMEVYDTDILKEFFLIDTSDENIKEVVAYQCPMSSVMSEIIVIKADDVETAKEILNNRRTKAIEQDAWYPRDAENAEASIVGTVGNYAYFVINDTASEDVEQLNTLLENVG